MWITKALQHYPLDENIEIALKAGTDGDVWGLLEGLDDVWFGGSWSLFV